MQSFLQHKILVAGIRSLLYSNIHLQQKSRQITGEVVVASFGKSIEECIGQMKESSEWDLLTDEWKPRAW